MRSNQRVTIPPGVFESCEEVLMYPAPTDFAKGLAFATRLGLELVVAVAVGAVLGYGLDRWLGSEPWAMIVGVFLGGVAGILTVYRTVMRSGT